MASPGDSDPEESFRSPSNSPKRPPPRKEIETWDAPWSVFALDWSDRKHPTYTDRFAVGSFVERYANEVAIVQYSHDQGAFVQTGKIRDPYPTTRIKWIPDPNSSNGDLLCTTGDYLRLYKISDGDSSSTTQADDDDLAPCNPELVRKFVPDPASDHCAPLTSCDWSKIDISRVATCSIDTTCAVWDVETGKIHARLIAHEQACVNDLSFSKSSKDKFTSVGGDGSVRLFDLRELEHSTILFEEPDKLPILRVECDEMDDNFVAFVTKDNSRVGVLDARKPSVPVHYLSSHSLGATCVNWAPHSPSHLCSAGEDGQVLIWGLNNPPHESAPENEGPMLQYDRVAQPISNLSWSSSNPKWIAIGFNDKVQVLRV